jgi:endonuclease YncB( thermonuclease family)
VTHRYLLPLLLVLATPALAKDVIPDQVRAVSDGDTAWFLIDGEPRAVRFARIDTPELFRPRCEAERDAARRAKAYVVRALRSAQRVELRHYRRGRGGFERDLAEVWVDGRDLAAELIANDLADPYHDTRDWCPDSAAERRE